MSKLLEADLLEERAKELRLEHAFEELDKQRRWIVVETPFGRFLPIECSKDQGFLERTEAELVAHHFRGAAAHQEMQRCKSCGQSPCVGDGRC